MFHSGPFHTPPARPQGWEVSSEPLPWTAAARAGAGQVLRKKPQRTSGWSPSTLQPLAAWGHVCFSELLSVLGARINPTSSAVMRQGHFGETNPTIWRFLEHPPHSPVAALLPVLFLSALPQGPRGWLPHPCSCLLRSHPRGVAPPPLSTWPPFVVFPHALPEPSPGWDSEQLWDNREDSGPTLGARASGLGAAWALCSMRVGAVWPVLSSPASAHSRCSRNICGVTWFLSHLDSL